MKALQTGASGGKAVLGNVEVPRPSENEALVKVIRAGICNTDLELLKGYMNYQGTLGHEFLGEVITAPTGSKVTKGQRVVGEINLACDLKSCDVCQQGGIAKRNHCPNREVLGILEKDGAFAEYVTLPVSNLHVVPDEICSRSATFAEPLAAAFRIAEQVTFKHSDCIAVIGDGKLAQLITSVLTLQPHRKLVIFGKYQEKMDLAPEEVERVFVEGVLDSEHKDMYDVVVEASGSPSGLMLSSSLVKPLGTVVLKTTCVAADSGFNTAPFVIKEVNIVGSRCGNFEMALSALKEGKIKVDHLVSAEYSFEAAEEAVEHAARKGTLKVQLVMDPLK